MRIRLLAEDRLRLEGAEGPMNVESASDETAYSPGHMLASGLAVCTISVLHSWAAHAGLEAADLAVEVQWRYVEDPYRIGEWTLEVDWPSLPAERRAAAERAAAQCSIKKSLEVPPRITTRVRGDSTADDAAA